jgi:hypothetical protein
LWGSYECWAELERGRRAAAEGEEQRCSSKTLLSRRASDFLFLLILLALLHVPTPKITTSHHLCSRGHSSLSACFTRACSPTRWACSRISLGSSFFLRRTKVAFGKCDPRTHGYYRWSLHFPARSLRDPTACSLLTGGRGVWSSDWGDNSCILIGDAIPAGTRRASKSVMCQSSCVGMRWFGEGVVVGHCAARNGIANGHLESIHVRYSVIRPS